MPCVGLFEFLIGVGTGRAHGVLAW